MTKKLRLICERNGCGGAQTEIDLDDKQLSEGKDWYRTDQAMKFISEHGLTGRWEMYKEEKTKCNCPNCPINTHTNWVKM